MSPTEKVDLIRNECKAMWYFADLLIRIASLWHRVNVAFSTEMFYSQCLIPTHSKDLCIFCASDVSNPIHFHFFLFNRMF